MFILTSRSFQLQPAAKGVEISIPTDMNINNKCIPGPNPKLATSRETRPQQLVQVNIFFLCKFSEKNPDIFIF